LSSNFILAPARYAGGKVDPVTRGGSLGLTLREALKMSL